MPIKIPQSAFNITSAMQEKAWRLKVGDMNETTWVVSGGKEPHIVTWLDGVLSCDCKSFEHRGTCSHCAAIFLERQNLFK